MNINVRRSGYYSDVSVEEGNTTIDLGLLDANEKAALVDTLVAAANELCGEDQEVIIKEKD
jgi:hypothetical protein